MLTEWVREGRVSDFNSLYNLLTNYILVAKRAGGQILINVAFSYKCDMKYKRAHNDSADGFVAEALSKCPFPYSTSE